MSSLIIFNGNHLGLFFLRLLFLILFFCLVFPFSLVNVEVFNGAGEKKI